LQWLIQAIDPQHDGKHASEKKANGREPGDPVETFAQPVIVLDTPSAALFASPATIASFSGQDTSLTAQGDVHAAAAHTASLISGQTTSLYTHQGELQAIAANGNLSLRAHTDALELLADDSVSIVSVNDEITITASTRIEMIGGDSKVVLDGGNIDFITPGSFVTKAATHEWAGGASGQAVTPNLPEGQLGRPVNFIELNEHYDDLEARKGAPFKLTFADGSTRTGTLDDAGFARIEGVPAGVAKLELGEDPRKWKMAPKVPNEHANAATGDDAALSLMNGGR
jgi:type VI secretion system secreted protein VgrG